MQTKHAATAHLNWHHWDILTLRPIVHFSAFATCYFHYYALSTFEPDTSHWRRRRHNGSLIKPFAWQQFQLIKICFFEMPRSTCEEPLTRYRFDFDAMHIARESERDSTCSFWKTAWHLTSFQSRPSPHLCVNTFLVTGIEDGDYTWPLFVCLTNFLNFGFEKKKISLVLKLLAYMKRKCLLSDPNIANKIFFVFSFQWYKKVVLLC